MNQIYSGTAMDANAGKLSVKTQERALSTLDMVLDQLAGNVSAVEFGFERLADKLKPVRGMTESPSTQDAAPQLPNCQMEERILQMSLRIQTLQKQIDLVNMQVCV